MKKIYAFMIAAIALGAVACNNDSIDEVVGGANNVNGDYITTLTVSLDGTRTSYSEGKTFWSAGDEISLNGSVYTLTEGANTGEGTFSLKDGETPVRTDAGNYDVKYPANYESIPTAQTAVDGSFDPKAAVLGTNSNGYESFTLCPYHALLKFTVAADANSVSVLGYTLSGNIKAGTTYYIAVEPKTYNGLTATIDGVDVRTTAKDVKLEVRDVLNLGNFDEKLVFLMPNVWDAANVTEWYAAHFWNDSSDMQVKLTDKDGDGIYGCVVPEGMVSVLFCRVNSEYSEFNWDGVWNKTRDLGVVSAPNNYHYIYSWERSLWGKKDVATKVADYGIVGTIDPDHQWNVADDGKYLFPLYDEGDGTYSAYGFVLPANVEFKLVSYEDGWDESYGTGTAVATDTWYKMYSGGGNIKVETAGIYNMYFKAVNDQDGFKYEVAK